MTTLDNPTAPHIRALNRDVETLGEMRERLTGIDVDSLYRWAIAHGAGIDDAGRRRTHLNAAIAETRTRLTDLCIEAGRVRAFLSQVYSQTEEAARAAH